MVEFNKEFCDVHFRKNDKMKVVFTKKNGEERTMFCTRKLEFVPKDKHPQGTGRPASTEAYPVFDLEADGWRSFRFDSIISMEPADK